MPRRSQVAIVGVGHSAIGRRLERPLGLLAKDAVMSALADAGLLPLDIDGAATYPVNPAGTRGPLKDGETQVSLSWIISNLGLSNITWWAETQTGNISTAIEQAAMAIAQGRCRRAIIWRALHMPKQGSYQATFSGGRAEGDLAFSLPYGLSGAPASFALAYMRYLKLYKAERRHMAAVVLASRRGAQLNPHAYFRDQPLTFDDYMDARMIVDPLCLFDCDIPVDGAGAIVLARSDEALDRPHAPAYLTGFGQASFTGRNIGPSIGALGPGLFEECRVTAQSIGRTIWATSGLTPADVDGAMLYDGFAPDIYFWLEGLGFCSEGEGFEFVQGGRIEVDGEFPINTFGGNLSEGRLHGIGHWIEATLQVQGRAGLRQISRHDNVLVATGLLGRGSGAVVSRLV